MELDYDEVVAKAMLTRLFTCAWDDLWDKSNNDYPIRELGWSIALPNELAIVDILLAKNFIEQIEDVYRLTTAGVHEIERLTGVQLLLEHVGE